jgi:Uma2 family endonuclease
MGIPAEKIIHSLDEYFTLTKNENDIRYEYHFGEIVAMAGALLRHNHITGNTYAELKKQVKGRRCIPFNSDTRLKVDTNLWVYPDVMLSCNEEDINARLYVQHPSLIVEVLSESTRNVDYALKKHHYFKIATLKYFLLIETESIFIDKYELQKN